MTRYSTLIIAGLVVLLVVVAAMAFSAPTQTANSNPSTVSMIELSPGLDANTRCVVIADPETKTVSVVRVEHFTSATVSSVKPYSKGE